MGTAASSLFSATARSSGTAGALAAALALTAGVVMGDSVILLGGVSVHRAGERAEIWVRRALSVVLAALGILLIARGLIS